MPLIIRLAHRDPAEGHRVATPLELLFDLSSVIAIAAAAAGLHHAVAHAHYGEGVIVFLLSFFGIWWAWMNWTWFSSAYDDGSPAYRILSFVIMSGAVVMASGVEQFFDHHRLTLVLAGYLIMRGGMILLWLMAAAGDPDHRPTALRYAGGTVFAQVCWTLLIYGYGEWGPLFIGLFVLCGLIEMAVPFWAERHGMTPWHRHHIIERYSLLTIIVLGEALLSVAMALQALAAATSDLTGATDAHGATSGFDIRFVHLAIASLVIAFSMWTLYFTRDEHLGSRRHALAFTWGYGHVVIFAAGAAIGSGIAVLGDILAGKAHIPLAVGDAAVAIPAALYLFGLWFVRDRYNLSGARAFLLPVAALLCLGTPFLPVALEALSLVMLVTAVIRSRIA